MKRTMFFIILMLIVPLLSSAQDIKPKIREAGLNLGALNTFGIRYRSGNENTLLRLTLNSITGSNHIYKSGSTTTNEYRSAGVGFNVGFEKRKMISNNLDYYYGSDLLTSFSSNNDEYEPLDSHSKSWTVSPGVGIVLGFIWEVNKDINISAEVVPSVWYSYSKSTFDNVDGETKQISSGFNYGFNNSGANLTLSFRFGK